MAPVCHRACAGLVGALLMLSGGCTSPTPVGAAADFFPLHPEDTWVYEVVRPLRSQHTRMTVRVRGERYIAPLGRRCRLVEESYPADDASAEVTTALTGKLELYPVAYYSQAGFLYRALSLEYRNDELHDIGLGSSDERFLPDGLREDLTWESETTAYRLSDRVSYTVHQNHRSRLEPTAVEVPAGRFAGCIRVDTVALHNGWSVGGADGQPVVWYYSDWYAPGVGLVRTLQSNRPDGGAPTTRIELVGYDVAR